MVYPGKYYNFIIKIYLDSDDLQVITQDHSKTFGYSKIYSKYTVNVFIISYLPLHRECNPK